MFATILVNEFVLIYIACKAKTFANLLIFNLKTYFNINMHGLSLKKMIQNH